MLNENKERKITWYRSPVDSKILAGLNQRSDWKGLLQTLGHLGLLVLSGAAAWTAFGRLPIIIFLLLVFLHGTFWAFLLNAFHEFCHKSVFKTKTLNIVFLYVVSFLSWNNPVLFWASHQEHHKYTLHPPNDLEVVLPVKLTLKSFLQSAVVSPWDFYARLKSAIRLSFGRLEGEWENAIFPASAAACAASGSIGPVSSWWDRPDRGRLAVLWLVAGCQFCSPWRHFTVAGCNSCAITPSMLESLRITCQISACAAAPSF